MRAVADGIAAEAANREGFMVALLEKLVTMESPTDEPATHGPVLDVLGDALSDLSLTVRAFPGASSGGHIVASTEDPDGAQLLVGHCDTVWPEGTLKEMPLMRTSERVMGPGTFDMKAGLVQAIAALTILQTLRLDLALPLVAFFNCDEERGSPDSGDHLAALAKRAGRALILEPALGPEGRLKTSRKGGGVVTVAIQGRAAHAGIEPGRGASAIVELSHVVQYLHSLNDLESGITVNVGVISGGIRPNVVAPESRAIVEFRTRSEEDARELENKINALEPVTEGVSISLTIKRGRRPMEPTARNQTLWRVGRDAGRALGLDLEQASAGGTSDGNITSIHTATLDGLGAVGDGAHARHEFVEIDGMVERAALLALLLISPQPTRKGSPPSI